MRMLGEMAVSHPDIRSFTEFARVGLGNWAGFSVGWLYWFFWAVVIPIEAIAGANILQELGLTLPTWQTGCLLMVVMTGVNLMSARSFGEFEFYALKRLNGCFKNVWIEGFFDTAQCDKRG